MTQRYSTPLGRSPATGTPRSAASSLSAMQVLLGINVAVFVLFYLLIDSPFGPTFGEQMVMDPANVMWQPWTLLTCAFSHYDTNHLLFNMLGLWVFGSPVAGRYGDKALVGVYIGGALVASLAHLFLSTSPMLGASGAVLALSVVFALAFPQRKLLIWFILPMPAWLAVGAFVALDVVGLTGPGDGIAHAAHLGGAAFGAAAFFSWLRRR